MEYIKKHKKLSAVFLVFLLVLVNLSFLPRAFAGSLTGTTLVELGGASNAYPMIASEPQSFDLMFTEPTGGSVSGSLTINFDSWGGTVATTQSVSTSSCTSFFPGTVFALPTTGTLAASGNNSTNTITVTSVNSLTASDAYCVGLTSTSAVTNPAAGSYNVTITDASGNSQTITIAVLATGANAYTVTATVGATFTMSLSSTTDSFSGALSYSSLNQSSGVTTTISTNAKSGWIVWVEDSNQGLKSTIASNTIPVPNHSPPSNVTINSGTYGPGNAYYALGVNPGTGSPTVAAAYACGYTSGKCTTAGGLSNTTFYQLASLSSPYSGATFTSYEEANISATTPPATDYSDIITEIGSGSF